MKRLVRTVAMLVAVIAMAAAPVAEAQGRGRQSHTTQGQQAARPSSAHNNQSARPGSSSNNSRPGNNGNSHNKPQKPGNGNNGNNNRPGNSNGFRPGHNNGNHNNNNNNGSHNKPQKPGNGNNGNSHRPGNSNGFRPGHNNGHHNGHKPATPPPPHRPGGYHRPPMVRPGYRHPVPFFNNWHRPVPPPSWHYRPGIGPTFGSILGITLGATIDFSLQTLFNSGYNVANYGNNVVYLTNVPQMNYYWPEAALYYNNGLLCGSQFTYPSPYYDLARYNTLYNTFVNQYGMPIQVNNAGGSMSATWYGYGNRFVTIQFAPINGQYYTTLSFGN